MSEKPDHLNSWSKAELAMIRQNCCQTKDDKHFELFLYKAHQLKLNPLMNQIHSVLRKTDDQGKEIRTIITSIDGLRLLAERTGRYVPGEEVRFTYGDNPDIPQQAIVYVKKMDENGGWHNVPGIAYYKEYVQLKINYRTREKEPNSIWKDKPHVMLGKCAESLALRRAFPTDLAGIYTAEEMAASLANEGHELDEMSSRQESKSNKTAQVISQDQFQRIHDLIGERHDILERILKHCQLQDLKQLPAKDFEMMHRGIVNQFKRETRNHTTTEGESLNV